MCRLTFSIRLVATASCDARVSVLLRLCWQVLEDLGCGFKEARCESRAFKSWRQPTEHWAVQSFDSSTCLGSHGSHGSHGLHLWILWSTLMRCLGTHGPLGNKSWTFVNMVCKDYEIFWATEDVTAIAIVCCFFPVFLVFRFCMVFLFFSCFFVLLFFFSLFVFVIVFCFIVLFLFALFCFCLFTIF